MSDRIRHMHRRQVWLLAWETGLRERMDTCIGDRYGIYVWETGMRDRMGYMHRRQVWYKGIGDRLGRQNVKHE